MSEAQLSTPSAYPASWAVFSMARSHRALASVMLADLGLFPGQELILMHLWDQDGRSQKSLGHLQRLDHSTIAKSVRRLEVAGLVRREKSAEDGRVTLVFLTDAGRALEEPTLQVWQALERRTTRNLSPKEREQLVSLARKIIAEVE